MKNLILSILCLIAGLYAYSSELDDNYVYVGKSAGIYDAPSANNPTMNQFDEPVAVEKGMAFKKTGETKLYYKVVFQDMEKYIPKSACTTPNPLCLLYTLTLPTIA